MPLADLSGVDLDFDRIVTHGPAGEYGHPHHVQVSAYVRGRATTRVMTFGGPELLELSTAERAAKLHALKSYDHIRPYEGVPMAKWEALLVRYGSSWLERESYAG